MPAGFRRITFLQKASEMKIAPGVHVYGTTGGRLDTTTRTYGDIVASAGPVQRDTKRNCIVNPNAGSLWKLRFTRNAAIPPDHVIELDRLRRLADPAHLPARLEEIRRMWQRPELDPNARIAVHDGGTALHVAAKAYDVQAGRVAPTGLMQIMLANIYVDRAVQNNKGQTALHIAARSGSVEATEQLLERHTDLHSLRDKRGRTAFEVAVLEGGERAHQVKNWFYDHAELRHQYRSWQPEELNEAVVNRHRRTPNQINSLAPNRNIDINHKFANEDGRTVFHKAVLAYARALEIGEPENFLFQRQVLSLLLAHPLIDPNAGDAQGHTALHHLVQLTNSGHFEEILNLLMTNPRFDPNKRDHQNRTPLLHAARAYEEGPASQAIITHLLQLPDVRHAAVDRDGRSFVHHVVMRRIPIVNHLHLIEGVLLDGQDRQGAAPIHYAIEGNYAEFVRFALRHPERFNFNRARDDGRTPFHLAVIANNREFVETLLATGRIDPNTTDGAGMRPLDHAVESKSTDVLDALIETYTVEFNYVNRQGRTVLQQLLHQGMADRAASLLASRVDIQLGLRGANRQTALHTAVEVGAKAIVQRLLKSPNAISFIDDNQQTALHVAAQHPSYEVARLLLKSIKNAKLNTVLDQRDSQGRTALELAKESGNTSNTPFIRAYEEVILGRRREDKESGPSRSGAGAGGPYKSTPKATGSGAKAQAPGESGGSAAKSGGTDYSFDTHDFNARMTKDLACRILGIPEEMPLVAMEQEIGRAVRKLSAQHHPDMLNARPDLKAGQTIGWHEKVQKRITEAAEYLRNAINPNSKPLEE